MPKNLFPPIIFKFLIPIRTILRPIKIALVSCCLLFCFLAKGQINFFYNESKTPIPPQAFSFLIDTGTNRSIEQFYAIKKNMQPMLVNNINLTFKNEMLWLRLSLAEISNLQKVRFLMLRSPHINYVSCWIFQGDSVVQSFNPTGDHYPFNNRSFRHPDFVFPFPQTDVANTSLLLLIDKRNEQLNIPIHLFTEEGFIAHNQQDDLLAGIITGIGVLLFILNLFLFFKMKDRLYVFYGLYVLMAFFYIITDYGLSFMYFYPDFYQAADFTRPIATSLAAPLYVLFAIELLSINKQMPLAYKWAVRYLILYLLIFIVSMALLPNYGIIRIVLLWLMQIFQNLNSIITLTLAIIGVRKKIPYSGYMIASSCILLIAFLLYMNFLSGYLADSFLTRNLMNLGFTLEISILAFVLTLRFRDYKERSEALLRQVNVQQEDIFKNLSDYREKDMLRISSQLHDSVGASLSAIRLNLESAQHDMGGGNIKIENTVKQVTQLANEVRQLSHGLSPILLQKKGLIASLTTAVENINNSNKLYIQFESIGSLQKAPFRYEMLIYNVIQELIQNIIKHSGATEAIIQLMLEKEMVSILVEDNGQSFNEALVKDGLGFLQIKQLVTFVNGNLLVNATANSGCQVSIEFPVLADERTHKDSNS